MCALEAVPPCKCRLAPLAFNCGFQESNNIVFVKYNRVAARHLFWHLLSVGLRQAIAGITQSIVGTRSFDAVGKCPPWGHYFRAKTPRDGGDAMHIFDSVAIGFLIGVMLLAASRSTGYTLSANWRRGFIKPPGGARGRGRLGPLVQKVQ